MGSVLGETKVFEKLIDALSSKFSLREIASAYCKAGRDPDLAAQILYGNNSNAAAAVVTTTQCGGTSSNPSLCESIANKPDKGADHKCSKPTEPAFPVGGRVSYAAVAAKSVLTTTQYGGTSSDSDSDSDSCESIADKPNMGADHKGSEMAFSVGSSVSPSVVGGGYYPMHNTPACCLICGPKPLGVDSKDFPVDELIDEKDQMHTDPFVAGKVLGRTVEVNKAVPRGEHNSPYSPKGFKKSNDNDGQFRTRKIFEEFKAYFEKFGRITKVYTVCDTITHQPRGFGFVNFDSEEAVEDVMQKRFHELNGKVVEVKRHVPKDRSNNGHSGGKGYAMHKTPAYGPVSPAKPLKVGIKDFPFDELTDDDVTSDSRVEDYQKHTGNGESLS
ncbi:hypothetical protein MKW94_017206 [Papaver nudicaule]|uniref:RRM domain-containing protein n=1 Tax=Papaver nudicaule TaxID=74823 RepID=A0AA42B4C0_PAPNU|nr:hypothetical protein [Papaver nudicaule]